MKKRAVRRLVVALILIGAAIVGLTLVDRLTVVDRPKPRPLPSIAVAPPPSEPAQPAPPAPPNGEERATTADATEGGKPPAPEVSQVPDAHKDGKPAPPPPAAGTVPALPASPGRAPSPATSPPTASPPPGGPVTAPAVSAPPQTPAQPRAGIAQPTTPPAASPPSGAAAPMLKLEDAPKTPEKGYTVQMGVFNTYNNADALLAKLKERGVPAYTETRVLVGPFRSRKEARQAAQTLKELGAGRIIPPPER